MSDPSINEWILERFILGELPRAEMSRIESRIQKEPGLKEEVDRLRQSDREILEHYPSSVMIREITEGVNARCLEKPSLPLRTFFKAGPVFATVAATLLISFLLILFRPFSSPNALHDPGRVKGVASVDPAVPMLHVFRNKQGDIEELRSGARAVASDLLQLGYTAGNFRFGMIFSIDGNGTVTLHFPYESGQNPLLIHKKLVFLNNSYELDRAPEYERFFFIYSQNKLDVKKVLQAADRLASDPGRARLDPLPVSENQLSILICKGDMK